ncbi:Protein CBFA2T3 [Tupaia chinensis]|uniref:Protein CBFA2T3 n=1 Tax=Tupaia chinensis TaxID=246437 RepID=L9KK58_TUPCH|nr:Protein CBFA2T3 [Tupaia chinensis]
MKLLVPHRPEPSHACPLWSSPTPAAGPGQRGVDEPHSCGHTCARPSASGQAGGEGGRPRERGQDRSWGDSRCQAGGCRPLSLSTGQRAAQDACRLCLVAALTPQVKAMGFAWAAVKVIMGAIRRAARQWPLVMVLRPGVRTGWRWEAEPAGTGCRSLVTQHTGQEDTAMPDSPAEVKTQPRSSTPEMPPPLPITAQGATRLPSFTPHTRKREALGLGTLRPVLVTSQSQCPVLSPRRCLCSRPGQGGEQAQLAQLFLTTLQQFGGDISPEIGERVRALVLGLLNSTLTIEEFHSKLQEATNFPLRPFVIPFLKANLPLLQRELQLCARLAKQTPAQYLAQHERLLLGGPPAPADCAELLLEVKDSGKRSTPDRTKENGSDRNPLHPEHPSKRPRTLSPGRGPLPTPPAHHHLEGVTLGPHFRDPHRHPDPRDLRDRHRQLATPRAWQEEPMDHRLTEREWAEEWKHLNSLLSCIMDMVERTRRSLTVLRRCQEADREELAHWARRYSDSEDMKKGPAARPLSSSASPEGSQAEEAVNEVKRQAMSELQKAVSDAERKAHELISTERAKMERALAEAKRQASEDALTVANQQEDSREEGPPAIPAPGPPRPAWSRLRSSPPGSGWSPT